MTTSTKSDVQTSCEQTLLYKLSRRLPWVFFVLALIQGLIFVWGSEQHIVLTSDAEAYWEMAQQITHWPEQESLQIKLWANIFRCPVFIVVLSLIQQFTQGFTESVVLNIVRSVQVLFYAGSIALMVTMSHQLAVLKTEEDSFKRSQWSSWVTGILALLYAPFLWQCDRILSEPMTGFFITLFIWICLTKRWHWFGLSLFLLFSNRFLTFSLLTGLLGLPTLLYFLFQRKKPVFLKPVLMSLAWGFVFPAILAYSVHLGKPKVEFSPGFLWYTLDTLGWTPMISGIGEQSFILGRYPVPQFSWLENWPQSYQQLLAVVIKNPLLITQTYLANLFRLIAYPENTYQQSFGVITPVLLNSLHWAMLLGNLVSLLMLAFQKECRAYSLFFLMIAVWLVLHGTINCELRYVMPVIPCLLVMGGLGWCQLFLLAKRYCGDTHSHITGVEINLGAILKERLVHLEDKYIAVVAMALLILLFIAYACERVFPHITPDGQPPVLSQFNRYEKNVKPGETVTRTIGLSKNYSELPSDYPTGVSTTTLLCLDVWPVLDRPDQHLKITVNGQTVFDQPYTSQLLPSGLGLQKFLLGGLRSADVIHQYRMIALPVDVVETIESTGRAEVSIQVVGGTEAVQLYGDLPQGNRIALPNPDWGSFSVYKNAYDTEGRLPVTFSRVSGKPLAQYPSGVLRVFLYKIRSVDERRRYTGDYPRPDFEILPKTGLYRNEHLAY